MTEQTDKMNYCCDCGWAVKKGLFRKTWYCTCPEILKKNLDTVLCIVDTKRTECRKLREDMFGDHFEFLPCPNYKGELRHHPSIPPMKCPLPCPPLPKRVEKAMEEEVEEIGTFVPLSSKDEILIHGKPLGDFVTEKMQKIKDLKEENRRLKET